MSVRVMSLVWAIDLPDSEKIVLLALADCANDEGHCWPGMKSLVRKCSKTDRTIQASIKRLVDAGHLTRREVPGKGCNYTVHPRSACAPEAASPPKGTAQTPEAASGKPSGTVISEAKASLNRVVDRWNELSPASGIPQVRVLNKSRTQMGLARLKEHGETTLLEAVERVHRSPFCRGKTGDGRKADIMMVLQPKTLARVLEGFYGEEGQKRKLTVSEQIGSLEKMIPLWERMGRTDDAEEARRKVATLKREQPPPQIASVIRGASSALKVGGGHG